MRFGLFSNGQGIREYERTVDAWDSDMREIVLTEKLGMDEAWISEHRATFPDALPAPELMITQAAVLTKKIRLGTAVRRLGLYNPLQVAREAACTDLLTHGRYTLGVGSGPVAPDHDQYQMMLESLDIIERALVTPAVPDYGGKLSLEDEPSVWPKPLQERLPIAVASTTPVVLLQAAKRNWRVLTSQWVTPKTVRRIATTYNEASMALGNPSRLSQITATRGLYIADTDERAMREVTPALRTHLDYTRKYFAFSLDAYLRPGQTAADLTVEQLIEDGLLFVGSPDTVAQRIEQFYEEAGGFGQFLIVGGKDWGDEDQRVHSFELFGEKVMPRLAHLDADAALNASAA